MVATVYLEFANLFIRDDNFIEAEKYIDLVIGSKSRSLFIFDKDGLKLSLDLDSYLMGSPALGQLDDDEDLEIVIGGYWSGNK